MTLLPSTLDFGTVTVGQNSAARTTTLYNGCVGKATLNGRAIGMDFRVASTTCTSTLKPGKSCDYLLTFHPLNSGPKAETFRVYTVIKNQQSTPVQLFGVGQNP